MRAGARPGSPGRTGFIANPDPSPSVECGGCGFANPTGVGTCAYCGGELSSASGALPGLPGQALMSMGTRFLERPPVLRALFEGERKYVTVLFADVANSTELIAGRDPEDAHDLLLPVVTAMIDAVHQYGGTVNQVLGDGIMVLFGAPLAQEDHAARACLAALAMQNDGVGDTDTGSLRWRSTRLRVGLNSGEVVLRAIENDFKFDYRAIGETVHLAARMQEHALPGQTLLTGTARELAAYRVQTSPAGAIKVKGVRRLVPTFELVGEVRHRRPVGRSRPWQTPAFVGRKREIAALNRALDEAKAGSGRCLALVGGAGVGKSRIIQEFLDSRAVEGCLKLAHGPAPFDASVPLLPVRGLVRSYLGLEEANAPEQVTDKIVEQLGRLRARQRYALPALLDLLGFATDDRCWHALDAIERRKFTFESVKSLFAEESRRQPLIVVLEDLHAFDSETLAILDDLLDDIASTRLLLLLSYRSEFEAQWRGRRFFTEHQVPPFTAEESRDFISALIGTKDRLGPVKEILIKRTSGIPFFLEECVRELIGNKTLVGDKGVYRLARPVEDIRIPVTVQAVLAARIDRLRPEDKRLLLIAAVIGKKVNVNILRDIVPLEQKDLHAGLERLQAGEFLDATRIFPEPELAFRHDLTHEVAYGTLLRRKRRGIHARIVQILEKRYRDRLSDYVELLAYHSYEGRGWEKALRYCQQAGAKALARSAHQEAATFFERALTSYRSLPDERREISQAVDLWLDLGECFFPLGDRERVLGCIREAQALAKTLGDKRRLCRATSFMALYHWMAGDAAKTVEWQHRACAIAEEANDFDAQIHAQSRLAIFLVNRGEYRRACEIYESILDSLIDQHIDRRFGLAGIASVLCRASAAWNAMELGEFESAIAMGEEGLRIAENANHPFSLVFGYRELGIVKTHRGDFAGAIALLERGRKLSETSDAPLLAPPLLAALGHAYALSGRTNSGLSLLRQGIAEARSMKLMFRLSRLVSWYGEALLTAGRLAEALDQARSALDLAQEYGEKGHEAWATWLLGEIYLGRVRPDAENAALHFRRAIASAQHLEMKPLLAHCRYGLSKVHALRGRTDELQLELSAAIELFGRMKMMPWLNRCEFPRHGDMKLGTSSG